MEKSDTTLLLVRRDGDSTRLASPDVGLFTSSLPLGSLLGPASTRGSCWPTAV